ncbi:hypothetical protein ALC62_13628 [Cyphomyrmex costatus]|uniref:Uncharacterized protein n=1 Tax=Cyphomyrmex costatus TaxID=456900 RepID=A0A151I9G8_9HYME|nr:hypothetical protein ALC62_13628 [Cyphomyrmex costatus]
MDRNPQLIKILHDLSGLLYVPPSSRSGSFARRVIDPSFRPVRKCLAQHRGQDKTGTGGDNWQKGEKRASRRTASRGRSMTTSREFRRDYRTPVVCPLVSPPPSLNLRVYIHRISALPKFKSKKPLEKICHKELVFPLAGRSSCTR